jgi:FkbM family methyltransferase
MSRDPMTTFSAPPRWLSVGNWISRRLPRGRHRMRMWLIRQTRQPFVAAIPASSSSNGLKFICDLRSNLSRFVFFEGVNSYNETLLVLQTVKPGMTFVDAGSHWGYFGLLAAERVGPSGRVIAIEAHPAIYEELAANVRLNGMTWLTSVHTALNASDGPVTLAGFDETSNCFETAFVTDEATSANSFTVPGRKLDSLLDELGIGDVDFLKMDIEGAEALCLPTMAPALARHRYKRIMLELHPQYVDRYKIAGSTIIAPLVEAGYKGWGVLSIPYPGRDSDGFMKPLPFSQLLEDIDLKNGALTRNLFWLAPGITLEEKGT